MDRDTVAVTPNGSGAIRIRLSAPAEMTVKVSRHSGNRRLGVLGSDTLEFTRDTWDQWQTVTFSVSTNKEGSGGATFFAEGPEGNLRKLFVFEKKP